MESREKAPREVWLDLDATDDPPHGTQEGRFFHGYHRCYCELPLYVCCGDHLLCARCGRRTRIRRRAPSRRWSGSSGNCRAWPHACVVRRGDSSFCREALMNWCEERGVDYLRLYLSSFAYVLLEALLRLGATGTELAPTLAADIERGKCATHW